MNKRGFWRLTKGIHITLWVILKNLNILTEKKIIGSIGGFKFASTN